MELIIKHFNELTTDELLEIMQLRVSVFVVEQHCPYQDIDGYDKLAYHLYYKEDGKIQAYLRVLPQNTLYDGVSIGRVISVKRRCGLATALLREGIAVAVEKFGARGITVGAQTYARRLYEGVGFAATSEEYLEDGIPHVHMQLDTSNV